MRQRAGGPSRHRPPRAHGAPARPAPRPPPPRPPPPRRHASPRGRSLAPRACHRKHGRSQ
eukprot:scaffold48347_cov68-Phaeocystis_antarctica.AAC.4